MRRGLPRALAALALAGALALAAGCGGDGDRDAAQPPPPPPPGSGYFVGGESGGLGASVDFIGTDPAARALRAAIGERGAVGIVSAVNDGGAPARAPRFVALLPEGGAVPIESAQQALAGLAGRAARRARAALGRPLGVVPARGGATLYVVLRAVAPTEVEELTMVSRPGFPVTLSQRSR